MIPFSELKKFDNEIYNKKFARDIDRLLRTYGIENFSEYNIGNDKASNKPFFYLDLKRKDDKEAMFSYEMVKTFATNVIRVDVKVSNKVVEKMVFSVMTDRGMITYELFEQKVDEYIKEYISPRKRFNDDIYLSNFKDIMDFLNDNKVSGNFSFNIYIDNIYTRVKYAEEKENRDYFYQISISVSHSSYWNQIKYFFGRMFKRMFVR